MSEPLFPRQLTIEWLRAMYATEAITPEDTIREIVRRVEEDADNPIWITPPTTESVRVYVERLNGLDRSKSPLWGIPFAVKDNIDVADMPTTAGCPDFAYVPQDNAAVVQRLIDAGAIPLGKTNLDQFATGLVGTRSPYGETKNALNSEWLSGGSSSGSAVAVARGHAAFALGTDTAGSGRVPAALNGLVGYKPSIGAWPNRGVVPACASLDCVTVFTHSLHDALTVDRTARGAHPEDPWSREVARAGNALPVKICLPRETPAFFGPLAEQYANAWIKAVQRLTSLGLPVEYVDIRLFEEAASILYDGPWVAERWAALGEFVDSHPGATFSVTETILRSGAGGRHTASAAFQAMHRLRAYKLEAAKLLANAILVMPTVGGTYTREQVRQDPIVTNSNLGKYTNHCNLLDLCAVALPCGYAAEDMPFGITLFGLWHQENLVCGAAEWMEAKLSNESLSVASNNVPSNDSSTVSSHVPPTGSPNGENSGKPATLVAVCGLHMRGFPLEKQMRECGAEFVEEASTAPVYRFVKLPTVPAKPGLVRCGEGGGSIRLEIWRMPLETFGGFAASIPLPLGIGKVELDDGRQVPGFLCEAYAASGAEDITSAGSWRNII